MCRRSSVAWVLALGLALGCSEDTRRFELVRVVPPAEDPSAPCGAPLDGRIVRVEAVGEFSPINITELIDVTTGEVELSQFPESVRALEVTVLGEGGVERTIGRSETFDASELEDGDQVTVFMAPRDGFCPTGPPLLARSEPLVARSGPRVLVAGGFDSDGRPVRQAEIYDPRTGLFAAIGKITYEPRDSDLGMTGASITGLPDGRVLIAGGPAEAYSVFDPDNERADVAALFLDDAPAFHAAVALDDNRVLLAGGCAVEHVDPDTRRCRPQMGSLDVSILDLESGDTQTLDSPLARPRIGGGAFLEGDGRVVLVGGVDLDGNPTVDAERIDPEEIKPREIIPGVSGIGAPLAGGGVVAAYGPTGVPGLSGGAVVPPGGQVVFDLVAVEAREGPTITPLEEGRLLVLGGGPTIEGDPAPEAQMYIPVDGQFISLSSAPADVRLRHGAVRLDDGSVFIVGGSNLSGSTALDDAWIFRPDLIGPFTPSIEVTFEGELAEHWVPRDLSRAIRTPPDGENPARLTIESSGVSSGIPSEWGVVAGPQLSEPKLTATVSADGAAPAIALIVSFRDEVNFQFVTLQADRGAELLELVSGLTHSTGCAGEALAANQIRGGPHSVELAVIGETLTVHIDEVQVLSCELRGPLPRGAVGIGVVGADGDTVTVDRISVSR